MTLHPTGVVILSALLFAGCATHTPSDRPQRLIVFGDSNVDNGNLYRLTGEKAPPPPNWKGRNSNGPNVAEYLAQNLNVQLIDYAISGATTGEHNIVAGFPGLSAFGNTGLSTQIDSAEAQHSKYTPVDIVLLWAGSNDIYGAARKDMTTLSQRINTAAANLQKAISRLHAMGARHFVVANRTPREVVGNENDLNGTDLNAVLAAGVDQSRTSTGADIKVYDAYGSVAEMMSYPQRFRFTEPNALCISVPVCAQEVFEQGQPTATKYIHWDPAHLTTRVHEIMAGQIAKLIAR